MKENIEHRIRAFGICTPKREVLDTRPFVGFGASELIRFGIKAGILEAAVDRVRRGRDRCCNHAVNGAGCWQQDVRSRIHIPSYCSHGCINVSGLTRIEAARLVGASDLVTTCASKPKREIVGPLALIRAGIAIPVFAMTAAGKLIIIEKNRISSEPVLIKATKLPATGDRKPSPLV